MDDLFSIGNLTDEQYRQVKRLRAELEGARASADMTAESFAKRLSEAEYLSAQCREALDANRAENERLQELLDEALLKIKTQAHEIEDLRAAILADALDRAKR